MPTILSTVNCCFLKIIPGGKFWWGLHSFVFCDWNYSQLLMKPEAEINSNLPKRHFLFGSCWRTNLENVTQHVFKITCLQLSVKSVTGGNRLLNCLLWNTLFQLDAQETSSLQSGNKGQLGFLLLTSGALAFVGAESTVINSTAVLGDVKCFW